ncbi:MAG: GNAT family N-acetyltransferase [Candidatus Helarchaeota archaeon]|nr:GNAT family N-acetyltransferase [Candidatus Helarchaeota archaeon]
MDFDIKVLQDPIPVDKISELYEKTYFISYFQSGANSWNSVKYTEWYLGAYHPDRRFFYSAWKGDQLIATMMGTPVKLKLENEIELNALSLGLTATLPEFQRQGIQKALLTRMIEDATKAGIDFIYGFPEKGFGGNELLKDHFNFKRFLKNQQHYIKVMGDYGRKILHEYRGLNIVLAKLLKLYAGIPKNVLQGGKIREGKESDMKSAVDIINSYQKRMILSKIWTDERIKYEFEYTSRLKTFDPPWGYHWKVWERDGKILATLFIRFETINFKNGIAPATLMSETCFAEETTVEERAGVIAHIVRWIRDEHPKIFIVQTTQPQYEIKTFKKLKFIDDTSTYEFLVLILSSKGEELNRYEKYKEFFIPYHR